MIFRKKKVVEDTTPRATKASEYAALMAIKPPEFIVNDKDDNQQTLKARVNWTGSLSMDFDRHRCISADEALAFAAWIIETFGEGEKE